MRPQVGEARARMRLFQIANGSYLTPSRLPTHVTQITLIPMDFDRLDEVVSPQQQAAGMAYHRTELQRLHEPHHHGNTTVREITYGTHTIRVVTSYDIEVDGQPVTGHLLVTNEGAVHYHAIPNQEFASALDMVKRIIDLAPDEFPDPLPGDATDHHDHGAHGGSHDHHQPGSQ